MRALVILALLLTVVPGAQAASSRASAKNTYSVRSVIRRTISMPKTSRSSHVTSLTSSSARSVTSLTGTMAKYAPYAPAVLGDGQAKILFFHAADCLACEKIDLIVKAWYPSRFNLPLYKIDFATQTALRSTYGVTSMNTFVRIGADGKKIIAVTDPTIAVLLQFLKR